MGGVVASTERVRLGVSALRRTGASELNLIASVNEAIKLAIAASENISLIAVNANLVAKRSGANAAGFCLVTIELRRYSDGMALTMQGWAEQIYVLVKETSNSRNQAQRLNKLLAAGHCSPKAQAAIDMACARGRDELKVITQRNSRMVAQLRKMVNGTEKQRMTGKLIARYALIEAAYGGEMQSALNQIALGMDDGIERFTAYSNNVSKTMEQIET